MALVIVIDFSLHLIFYTCVVNGQERSRVEWSPRGGRGAAAAAVIAACG